MDRSFFLITSDESFAGFLKERFEPTGYSPEWRRNGKNTSSLKDLGFSTKPIVLDLGMHDSLKSLSELRAYHPEAKIIVVSNGNQRKTAESLRLGASSLVIGKQNEMSMRESLARAFSEIYAREELEFLRGLVEQKIIAKSLPMKKTLKKAEEAASNDTPVLLLGELGTGRELLAKYIHKGSGRRRMLFVQAADENELPSAIMAARGGTLYLKEISVLGARSVEVLHSLHKDGIYKPEGHEIRADIRIMAGYSGGEKAGHSCLPFMEIPVPPLRERKDDIIPLAECFLEELSRFLKKRRKYLTKKAKEAISEREYRERNGGELKELVHKAYFFSRGQSIGEKDLFGSDYLSKHSFKNFIEERLRGYLQRMSQIENSNLFDTVITEVEKALIDLALKETGGNKLRAAKALGMNRNTFRAKVKQYRIKIQN